MSGSDSPRSLHVEPGHFSFYVIGYSSISLLSFGFLFGLVFIFAYDGSSLSLLDSRGSECSPPLFFWIRMVFFYI